MILEIYMLNHISYFAYSNKEYFENIDKSEIEKNFTIENIIKKLLKNKSGVCAELNYAFGYFLQQNNYNVKFIKTFKPKNESEYYDIFHLALIVTINRNQYFVDVGLRLDAEKLIILDTFFYE